jgi:hypothetical protein
MDLIGGIVVDMKLPDSVSEHRISAIMKTAQRCPVRETTVDPPGLGSDVV